MDHVNMLHNSGEGYHSIIINTDVYCMDYRAIKSSKNRKFVLRKLSVSSRQKQKLSVKFEVFRQIV